MNPKNYQFLVALVKQECGLALDPDRADMAETRLEAVARRFDRDDPDALLTNIMSTKSRQSVDAVVEAMVTNETFFFRDSMPFMHFEQTALPNMLALRGDKRQLRIWSAATSTGQEAYSLAMIMDRQKSKMQGWRTQIVATDISQAALKRAESGDYSQFEVQRGLPIRLLMQNFDPKGERWQIKKPLRQAVKFERFNLLSDPTELGQFDAIFCRNVLMYFEPDLRRKVIDRLAARLAPDGRLYLGGAETVEGLSDSFEIDDTGQYVFKLANAAQSAAEEAQALAS